MDPSGIDWLATGQTAALQGTRQTVLRPSRGVPGPANRGGDRPHGHRGLGKPYHVVCLGRSLVESGHRLSNKRGHPRVDHDGDSIGSTDGVMAAVGLRHPEEMGPCPVHPVLGLGRGGVPVSRRPHLSVGPLSRCMGHPPQRHRQHGLACPSMARLRLPARDAVPANDPRRQRGSVML